MTSPSAPPRPRPRSGRSWGAKWQSNRRASRWRSTSGTSTPGRRRASWGSRRGSGRHAEGDGELHPDAPPRGSGVRGRGVGRSRSPRFARHRGWGRAGRSPRFARHRARASRHRAGPQGNYASRGLGRPAWFTAPGRLQSFLRRVACNQVRTAGHAPQKAHVRRAAPEIKSLSRAMSVSREVACRAMSVSREVACRAMSVSREVACRAMSVSREVACRAMSVSREVACRAMSVSRDSVSDERLE